jgi:hypothetical protein
VHAVTDSA